MNLRGYVLTARYAIPAMLKRGGGAIVNMSSVASVAGQLTVSYGVSKAGVEALTCHIANRWLTDGIRANAVAPGLVHTPTSDKMLADKEFAVADISPLGRGATSEEVAALVAFLLSDECPYLAGQVIAVNGGFYNSPQ